MCGCAKIEGVFWWILTCQKFINQQRYEHNTREIWQRWESRPSCFQNVGVTSQFFVLKSPYVILYTSPHSATPHPTPPPRTALQLHQQTTSAWLHYTIHATPHHTGHYLIPATPHNPSKPPGVPGTNKSHKYFTFAVFIQSRPIPYPQLSLPYLNTRSERNITIWRLIRVPHMNKWCVSLRFV